MKRALTRGADAAEVYLSRSAGAQVTADASGVAPSLSAHESVTVRVVLAGRLGIGTAPSFQRLDDAIDVARRNAAGTAAQRAHALADPVGSTSAAIVGPWDETRAEQALALADALVREALAAPGATYAAGAYRQRRQEFAVANSNGLAVADVVASERCELEVRAEPAGARGAGRTAMDAWTTTGDLLAEARPGEWARRVAQRARDALDARPLGARPDRVLLLPAPANQILKIAAEAFSAAPIAARQSPLVGRTLGEPVLAPGVTLTDEPRGPRGARWRRFDDEGVPTRSTRLVERGSLAGVLHDTRTAAAWGSAPTGHGLRKGGAGNPSPRPVNLVVEPGDLAFDELLAEAGRAIVVTEPLLGAFTSNPVTGDFSVVAPFAFLAEGGRVQHALPPTSLGGNAHEALRRVQALGRDLSTYKAATLPSLVVEGISCAT